MLVQPVAFLGMDQHRHGFDAKLAQQPDKHDGLGLAIAEAALPGFIGARRDEAADAQRQVDVADLLLDQLKRELRPFDRVRAGGLDPFDFRAKRAIRSDDRSLFEQGQEQGGEIVPRLEVADVQRPPARETLRREGRWRFRHQRR